MNLYTVISYIERHCEVTNVVTEVFEQVNDFIQFTSQNILEDNENKYSLIKMEDSFYEEYQNFNNIAQIKEEYKLTCEREGEIIKIKEEIYDKGQNSNEGFMEMSNQKCLPSGVEEIKIKPNCDRFQEPFEKCKMAKIPSQISTIEKNPNELLKQHVLPDRSPLEKTILLCEICSYKTKHKCNLKRHLLTHKSRAEVNLFKCEMCPIHTKRKDHLKDHLLTHKSSSEVKVFKCEMCTYETKRKSNLKQHLLRHKSPSDVNMFKCEICPYETKHKCNIKSHLLTHKILNVC